LKWKLICEEGFERSVSYKIVMEKKKMVEEDCCGAIRKKRDHRNRTGNEDGQIWEHLLAQKKQ
jgi:hypothetical protein